MKLSVTSIRRPVLATVMSLAILLFGIISVITSYSIHYTKLYDIRKFLIFCIFFFLIIGNEDSMTLKTDDPPLGFQFRFSRTDGDGCDIVSGRGHL